MTYLEKHEKYQYLSRVLRDELTGTMTDKDVEDVIKYLFEKMFKD
jgi:hypothetical protein